MHTTRSLAGTIMSSPLSEDLVRVIPVQLTHQTTTQFTFNVSVSRSYIFDHTMASIITRRTALSCARSFSAPTTAPRLFPAHRLTLNLHRTSNITPNSFLHTTAKMSEGFSNTNVQNADPYKEKNKEEPPLKEKVEDLVSFIERCKFCMMSTRTKDGLIASRCMALAGKVSDIAARHIPKVSSANATTGGQRHRPHLPR